MSISMYQASIPHFIRMLGNLAAMLEKAGIHTKSNNIDESVFINARLAADMYPLNQQIRIAANMARACAARLAKMELPPAWEGNENTFAALKTGLGNAIVFLQSIDSGQIDSSYGQTITIKLANKAVIYPAQVYLLDVIIPHFYFHVTTAYAILRHHGVDLGKKDYIDNE
jgi:uncharacterized protein